MSSMTTKFKIGSIIDTPKGKVKVLDYTPRTKIKGKSTHARVTIQFVKSGWVSNVQASNIGIGNIRDFREPSVYGMGYLDTDIGIPMRSSHSIIRRIYDLWANMIKRCYGGYDAAYFGCTVETRWLSFKNFLNTISEVQGYDRWESGEPMHLDKDIKVKGNTLYSLTTCMFVTPEENVMDTLNRRWGKA